MYFCKDSSTAKCICCLIAVQAAYIILILILSMLNSSVVREEGGLRPIVIPQEYIRNLNISKLQNGTFLYGRGKTVASTDGKCHNKNKTTVDWTELLLCSDSQPYIRGDIPESVNRKHLMIFGTTFYHEENKQFIFNNTLHNWQLLRKWNVLPVLFISELEMMDRSGHLVSQACQLGWIVAMTPACSPAGYPILPSLFNFMSHWQALWYGYSNGDILFTDLLPKNLKYALAEDILFVTGSRYNAGVSPFRMSSHDWLMLTCDTVTGDACLLLKSE